MKTKLFVDFDGTMFDTSGFKEAIQEVFGKVGFSEADFLRVYQAECLNYKFSIEGLTERLKKIHDFNLSLTCARINKLFSEVSRYIYDDVEPFLELVDRSKYELTLLTLGDPSFQRNKVNNSGLEKYFSKILYTEIQKWDYLKKIVNRDEKFILIDDRSDTVHQISLNFPKALALEMERTNEDKDDPARNGHIYRNLAVRNFKQVASYI